MECTGSIETTFFRKVGLFFSRTKCVFLGIQFCERGIGEKGKVYNNRSVGTSIVCTTNMQSREIHFLRTKNSYSLWHSSKSVTLFACDTEL